MESAGPREEFEYSFRAPVEEAIKLDLATAGIVKEIARIETPIQTNDSTIPRHIQHSETLWGLQPIRRGQYWVWISFGVAIALLFAAIAWFNQHSKIKGASASKPPQLIVLAEDYPEESPQFVFQQNPYRARLACMEIFRAFTAAKKISDVLPLIRQQPSTATLLAKRWQPWPSPPMLDNPDQIISESDEAKGRGFFWIQGQNQNGSPFLAFFIAEGNAFRLDWEATMEIGEARLSTLARLPATNPIAMRVIAAPANYFLPTLPEREYECYQISSLQDETIVWGYVKRNSPEHQQLSEILEQYSNLLEAKQQARVTLRLRKTDDVSSQNRFFITEVLHKDWVTP